MMGVVWDVFCTVVDNFGDAGVAWRLARQLAAEHGLDVRLWIDDARPLAAMRPGLDAGLKVQRCDGIEVRAWPTTWPEDLQPGDVVIEAFGCPLPSRCLEAMAQRAPASVWINLEYLSAEPWVAGCHGLPSPHPLLPLVQHFYFPGFTQDTGGLLRERDLAARRAAFVADAGRVDVLWAKLGVPSRRAGEQRISLFAYENPALPRLLDAWSQAAAPLRVLVPEGKIVVQLEGLLGRRLPPGDEVLQGAVRLQVVPFVDQDSYDALLWACDVNFVRGEDSFVRAQWARRPFVWHIYPQLDEAHRAKLQAFLDRYCRDLPAPAADAMRALWRGWNGDDWAASAWSDFLDASAQLAAHAARWAEQQMLRDDLATELVRFARVRGAP